MLNDFDGALSRGELGEGNTVSSLVESVDDGEYSGVSM